MRKIKKIAAVAITAAMTMAMGISAFAGEVTFHFKNVKGWETVGAWIYEGKAFDINVTPADKCAAVNGEKQLWPGAKCEDEGNGWVKVTANFTGEKPDAVLLFNNWVADNTTNDTTTQEDLDKLQASGVLCDSSKKEQTPNIMLGVPKDGWAAFDASEYWIEWDGASTALMGQEGAGVYKEAPASYSAPSSEAPAEKPTTNAPTDATGSGDAGTGNAGNAAAAGTGSAETGNAGTGSAGTGNAGSGNAGTGSAGTGNTGSGNAGSGNAGSGNAGTGNAGSGSESPKTGDAASMAVVLFGLAAAAFAVSKKVNA